MGIVKRKRSKGKKGGKEIGNRISYEEEE